MKLTLFLAAVCALALVGCDDDRPKNDSQTTATYPPPVTAPVSAPDSAPVTVTAPVANDPWANTQAQKEFAEKAQKIVASLKLPSRAELKITEDASKEAKVFVGLRCEIFVAKLKRAKKGPTNLYDAAKLNDVCSSDNVRLVPGASVVGSASTGFIFPMTSTKRISVRPDFTVSGYEIESDSQLVGHSVETVVIDGGLKIEQNESKSGVDLTATELSGRYTYQSRMKRATRREDASIWKSLELDIPKTKHKLTINETQTASNDMAFTIGRSYKVGCSLLLTDSVTGKTLNSAHLNEPCF